jgi:hypothetical protein
MKMGNIASPRRYDNVTENAIEATLMPCGRPSGCADAAPIKGLAPKDGHGIICHT